MNNKNKIIEENGIEEENLRSFIRESLTLYSKNKQKLREDFEKEQVLRNAIRELLISEAKASKQPPPGSTLEGILNTWLKNVIGNVKIKFLNLQDGIEEQEGFITTFLNGISELFMFPEMEAEKEKEEELEEEKSVKLKYGAFDDLDAEDKPEPEMDDTESDTDDEPASDLMGRGKRFAYKELQSLTTTVQDILKDIIPQERENARQTVLKNFGAWMDYWSMNNDAVSNIIQKTLGDLGVSIDQDELPSEEQPVEEPIEEPTEEPIEEPVEEPTVPDETEEEPALEEEIDFDFE